MDGSQRARYVRKDRSAAITVTDLVKAPPVPVTENSVQTN